MLSDQTLDELKSMATSPPEGKSLDTFFRILGGIQEQIRFADSKAAFLAVMNALLFGFMAKNFESVKAIYKTYGASSATFWIPVVVLGVYMISTMISLFLVVLAVMSRFGKLAPQSNVFFGHIARDYGKDYEKYVQEAGGMTDTGWVRDLGTQIVELSHIALGKHERVRRSANWVLVAGSLWVVSFVLLLCMSLAASKKDISPRSAIFREKKAINRSGELIQTSQLDPRLTFKLNAKL